MASDKFVSVRKKMVMEQLAARGIKSRRVLKVMALIPREKFVLKKYQNEAYGDYPLEIGYNQTISQPYIVALMTELLELSGREKVLEIGTGSGYQAAILSRLAKKVYSLERHEDLALKAQKLLKKLGFLNVKVIVGDGFLGYAGAAPYQAIILTAAPLKVPKNLVEQLDEDGRLVAPVGAGPIQRLVRLRKVGKKIQEEDFVSCAFVPLVSGVEE